MTEQLNPSAKELKSVTKLLDDAELKLEAIKDIVK